MTTVRRLPLLGFAALLSLLALCGCGQTANAPETLPELSWDTLEYEIFLYLC